MVIFNLTPFSGHISKVAQAAHEIATRFPEHHFTLTFNDKTVTVSGLTVNQIVEEYLNGNT